jgi:hypothetical protein
LRLISHTSPGESRPLHWARKEVLV